MWQVCWITRCVGTGPRWLSLGGRVSECPLDKITLHITHYTLHITWDTHTARNSTYRMSFDEPKVETWTLGYKLKCGVGWQERSLFMIPARGIPCAQFLGLTHGNRGGHQADLSPHYHPVNKKCVGLLGQWLMTFSGLSSHTSLKYPLWYSFT